MIVLNDTDGLRLTTSAVAAVDVHATYVDSTSTTFTPGRQNTAIASATTTTVVSAPSSGVQRGLKTLSIVPRGGAQTLTVVFHDGSTTYQLRAVQLAVGESLHYDDAHGWRVLAADGSLKQTSTTGVGATQMHLSWAPNAAAQTSNLLTLLAAGHPPGLYQLSPHVLVKTVQAGSFCQVTYAWGNGGAQTVTLGSTAASSLSIATLGIAMPAANTSTPRPTLGVNVYSDGGSAITLQMTVQGTMAGAALLDAYGSACRVGT